VDGVAGALVGTGVLFGSDLAADKPVWWMASRGRWRRTGLARKWGADLYQSGTLPPSDYAGAAEHRSRVAIKNRSAAYAGPFGSNDAAAAASAPNGNCD
jgi:hypothetical protein